MSTTTVRDEYGIDWGDEIEGPWTELEEATERRDHVRRFYAAEKLDFEYIYPGNILSRQVTTTTTEWQLANEGGSK